MEPPSVSELSAQIERLQHQMTTVLYLSGINFFLNAAILAVSFLLSLL